jgi:hypothetical protein
MTTMTQTSAAERRKTLGLLPGSILAACLALVFGACLCTILDALHPPRQTAASARSQSSRQAAPLLTAAF